MEFPAELRGEVERLLSEENTDKLAKAAEGISARYRSENARDVRGCEPFAGAGSGVSPTGR